MSDIEEMDDWTGGISVEEAIRDVFENVNVILEGDAVDRDDAVGLLQSMTRLGCIADMGNPAIEAMFLGMSAVLAFIVEGGVDNE